MPNQKNLKVTLVRSISGRLPKHKATVASLGLRRMHQTIMVKDNASTRGMLNQVSYLIAVEEV